MDREQLESNAAASPAWAASRILELQEQLEAVQKLQEKAERNDDRALERLANVQNTIRKVARTLDEIEQEARSAPESFVYEGRLQAVQKIREVLG